MARLSSCSQHMTVLVGLLWLATSRAAALDLTEAIVLRPKNLSGPEQKAVTMLVEEVQRRTQLLWTQDTQWPSSNTPVILVASRSNSESLLPHSRLPPLPQSAAGPEGYTLLSTNTPEGQRVLVLGNAARGVLFGCGRLLRELRLQRRRVSLPDDLRLASAPKYPLRGHQLGYRPKCNSYDAWDLPVWEQYYRDLIVFGCNAVELIPPRSDDDADSPHFPRPPMEMMMGMSRLADAYGLDVWLWYPAMDADYSQPATVESAFREWGEVFARLPRVDAVFVPGGDPGHTRPRVLMGLLEKQKQNLRRFHPKAQMWVSPQSFNQAWLDEFIQFLRQEHPAWLDGIVYGPQVRISLERLRELVPRNYPIRNYPDITHSRQCEYPVPDWDRAFAVTEARECINPRPQSESIIFHKTQPHTIGFITYSEGCNDDVNKAIWSALGWDPELPVTEILRQYSRYFVGERYEVALAEGLLALENNWRGSLLTNELVETTLARFQTLERQAAPADLRNWRLQQALFRAYYDAYTRRRLVYETGLENRAMERLREDCPQSTLAGMDATLQELQSAATERVALDLRTRIFALGEALFQSIGMQLSVEKYRAIAVDRGASLDTIDFPLNNRPWLAYRFAQIRRLSTEAERLQALRQILNWEDPGPGGFYDDLGNPARQPHLVGGAGFAADPESMKSPRVDFEEDLVVDEPDEKPPGPRRTSWIDHAESLYDAPLSLRYEGLDPNAAYHVRVVYAGDSPKRKIRLAANSQWEIHPFITKPFPYAPIEFAVPRDATRSGQLTLTWTAEAGLGGNGRACQVSEVWLLRDGTAARP